MDSSAIDRIFFGERSEDIDRIYKILSEESLRVAKRDELLVIIEDSNVRPFNGIFIFRKEGEDYYSDKMLSLAKKEYPALYSKYIWLRNSGNFR